MAFESVLRLDPGHARARERLAEAERRTGEALFARWLPNQEPTLTLFEPETATVEARGADDLACRASPRTTAASAGSSSASASACVAEQAAQAAPQPERSVRFVRGAAARARTPTA